MVSSSGLSDSGDLLEVSTEALELIDGFVEAFSNSESATALCRTVVHGDFTHSKTVGCQLFWLDHQAELKLVAGYGLAADFGDYSTWGDTALAEAIRARDIVIREVEQDLTAVVIPFFTNGDVPIGAMVIWLRDYNEEPTLLKTEQGAKLSKMLGSLGAFYLRSSGIGSWHGVIEAQANSGASGEDLTERQRTILAHMADGLTNAEIARLLMLSESSIRQETVRIYRALGVKSRVEASKKGQALGLIGKRVSPEVI
jgi:DNA-binding CsgD family transcriptional regulator